MKRLLLAAVLAAASLPASATSLGFSIGFEQPGLHGTIHVGDFYRPHRPRVIYPQPVVVYPAPLVVDHRPAYHRGYKGYGHWKKRHRHRHHHDCDD